VAKVQEAAETDAVRDLVTELAVEPMQSVEDDDPRYAKALLVRLEEMALTRRIQELKSKLQRVNPVDQAVEYNRMFGELIVLETQKKGLREQSLGEI
jgi:DNA primase